MFTKPPPKKKDDGDVIRKVIGGITEESEKFVDSAVSQVTGRGTDKTDQPNPIAEAMQQKTEADEIEKQNKLNKQRKFIRTREELDNELQKLKQQELEREKQRMEETERRFKIVDPGGGMEEKPVIPLTTKPKRGQMPGRPGTAKGESGPEVRRSKQ